MKTKIINSILGILISIFLLITAIQYFSFSESYLYKNIDKNVPVSQEDLHLISEKIANYLEDKEDNLIFNVKYEDHIRPAFNEREIHHMIDVKNIYSQLNYLKLISLLLIIGIILIIRKNYLFNAMYYAAGMSFGLSLLLGIIISINFNKAFIFFHEIAFSNDLWLLNPKTDLLINLLPLSFFIKISINIVLLFSALQFIGVFIVYKTKKVLTNL